MKQREWLRGRPWQRGIPPNVCREATAAGGGAPGARGVGMHLGSSAASCTERVQQSTHRWHLPDHSSTTGMGVTINSRSTSPHTASSTTAVSEEAVTASYGSGCSGIARRFVTVAFLPPRSSGVHCFPGGWTRGAIAAIL